ncbi:MAG: hypothetical protein R2854_13240 [Caldilineaceae bacterium]
MNARGYPTTPAESETVAADYPSPVDEGAVRNPAGSPLSGMLASRRCRVDRPGVNARRARPLGE